MQGFCICECVTHMSLTNVQHKSHHCWTKHGDQDIHGHFHFFK